MMGSDDKTNKRKGKSLNDFHYSFSLHRCHLNHKLLLTNETIKLVITLASILAYFILPSVFLVFFFFFLGRGGRLLPTTFLIS